MVKQGLSLIARVNLGTFNNEELERFRWLVYHPILGTMYRYRYVMVRDFLTRPVGNLLEIGFGPGIFIPTVLSRCSRYYGIEIHREVDRVARALRGEKCSGFYLVNGDIARIPFRNETFDFLICQSVLEHLVDLDSAVQEISRILKRGGKALIGFPVKNMVTKALFALLGYNDEVIHPSNHTAILKSLEKIFIKERIVFFPPMQELGCALYCVSMFLKK